MAVFQFLGHFGPPSFNTWECLRTSTVASPELNYPESGLIAPPLCFTSSGIRQFRGLTVLRIPKINNNILPFHKSIQSRIEWYKGDQSLTFKILKIIKNSFIPKHNYNPLIFFFNFHYFDISFILSFYFLLQILPKFCQ